MQSVPDSPVPTTVFSGFLGSGKTTIITHLVEILQNRGQQIIYIKNEIGDTDIDGQVLSGKNIKTKELLNGCICCTLVGPFVSAVEEIISTYQPDRILIEASGAADPAALALMIDSQPQLKRDGVIGIIDVVNFEGYKDLTITAQNQTKFTDLLVFNKIELTDLGRKQAVVGYVRELNAHSPIIEAPQGKVKPEVVFGSGSAELEQMLTQEKESHDHDTDNHIEDDAIQSITSHPQGNPTQEQFISKLNELPKAVFRAKGFITLADGQTFVFNRVGTRTTLEMVPDDLQGIENTVVLIGWRLHDKPEPLRMQFE